MNHPRPFYLIAHTPNTVDVAAACLAAGANALEPDVYYTGNNFYVIQGVPVLSKILPLKKGPLLADYLTGLQTEIFISQITDNPLNLSLILFNTKNLGENEVNKLTEIARANFTLPNVRLEIVTGNKKYLDRFVNFSPKKPSEMAEMEGCASVDGNRFFQQAKTNHTYANGTRLPLMSSSSKYLDEVRAAMQLRDHTDEVNPILVYARTVNSKTSMRSYLRLGVDGFITDNINDAASVIAEPEFAGKI